MSKPPPPGQLLLVPPGTRCVGCHKECDPVAVASGHGNRVVCQACKEDAPEPEEGAECP